MRFIVDNGAYTLRNMGDIAMLQVTLKRIRERFPGAECLVLSSAPALLERYCPGATPLSVASRNAAYLPPEPGPGRWKTLWKKVRGRKVPIPPNPGTFRQALASADRVVVSGGGFLNDLNHQSSLAILRMLEDAAGQGKQVALFGQGLGPMENPELLKPLGNVLRAGGWLGLRESRRGPAIAATAGALNGRIAVTGDDAIEPAWKQRLDRDRLSRQGIGFSIRRIEYSGIQPGLLQKLTNALALVKTKLAVPLVPLPISFNPFEDDPSAITQVTGEPCATTDLPEAVIQAAGRARVVVSGTYHAAVFALAQGIPCACFYASDYYRDKLEGLAAQFGRGCMLMDLRHEDFAQGLAAELEHLWATAPALSETLQEAAAGQVRAAREFYQQALKD